MNARSGSTVSWHLRFVAWAAARGHWFGSHGIAIEAGVLAGAATALVAVVLPLCVAIMTAPDAHPFACLREACHHEMRGESWVVAGYGAAALLAAWGAMVLLRIAFQGSRDVIEVHRRARAFEAAREIELCAAGRVVRAQLVASEAAFAFCAGLVRPRIYVSTTLLARVSSAELEATLIHELAHARSRDPLRCWLVELILGSIWFPWTRRLGDAYREAREARADAIAANRMGDERPLLRALLKADALMPRPDACGLTAERHRALRHIRRSGPLLAVRERMALVSGLSMIAGLMLVAATVFPEWHTYWLCAHRAAMI